MGSGNSSSAASSLRIARWPLGSYFLHEHLTKQCCVKGGILIFCVVFESVLRRIFQGILLELQVVQDN